MADPQQIVLFLYNLTLVPVIFFTVIFLFLAFLNIFGSSDPVKSFRGKFPFITVQVPVFNDPVAKECIEKCLKFDYPKDKYEIFIVDDSTDKNVIREMKSLTKKNKAMVRYIHRDNREGYKPGALQNAMRFAKGEFMVIFDADWRPQKDFLKKIITPMMKDSNVAIVQAKQTFVNLETNMVSRFAAYLLIIYHSIIMPLNNKVNAVFFCGTAGAIRRDALESVGGWNSGSITEDADLSVKLLSRGYRNVYLNMPVPSEVPITIEGFIKQQMRWTYGLTRTFLDNVKTILFSRKLKLPQRMMISYTTMGNIIAPVVILMTILGMSGWFLGDPELFKIADVLDLLMKFVYTSGFLVLAFIAFAKENKLKHIPHLIASTFSVSIVLVAFNSVAFLKAVFKKPLYWYRTPKTG